MSHGDAPLLSSMRHFSAMCGADGSVREPRSQRPSLVRWLVPAFVAALLLLLPFTGTIPAVHAMLGKDTVFAYQATPAEDLATPAEEEAHCFFDVSLASTSLAAAAATINRATHNCDTGRNLSTKCDLDLTKMFVMFAEGSSYFLSGISNCPTKFQRNRMCEARIAKLLAAFGQIGVAAQRMSHECNKTEEAAPVNPNHSPAEVATCAIEGSKAVLEFGEGVMYIARAARYCPKAYRRAERQVRCAVSLQGALASLGTSANTFATLALDCAKSVKSSHASKCDVDISKLVIALVNVATSATGLHLDCVLKANNHDLVGSNSRIQQREDQNV